MTSLRRTFRVVSVVGTLLLTGTVAISCGSDDESPGEQPGGGSGGTSGSAGTAGTAGTAGAVVDGGAGAAGTAGDSGWQPGDGGVVVVEDGGVVITDDAGNQFVCYPTTCDGKLLQCGDCLDNDNDGKVDWTDRECLGPCDNTEGPGLDSDVGGTTGTSCGVDCYFDYGNGPGNDMCMWDHRCDPLVPEKSSQCGTYVPSMVGGKDCPDTQVQQCADFCIPYTPNGCDCFGCCTFPQLKDKGPDGGIGYVWIGAMDDDNVSTCTFDDILDPVKCPPCTPVGNCLND
ncbi:MAG TPA: hypothetical protein PLI95_05595, partial [Polyangiaceae bacterium]|nr:hypothetical protein [Polyangiaceae bacterium]